MKVDLPEIVAVGIFNTKGQIAFKNVTVSKNRKIKMFEIELPIENGGVSFIENEKNEIKTDTIICAKPGQTRHTKLPFKCYYIHMIVEDGEFYDLLMNLPNFIKTRKQQKYAEIYERIIKHYENGLILDELITQSLVLELVYLLVNDSEKLKFSNTFKTGSFKSIDKIIKYIKLNLTDNLSLESVAKVAGFSPIHFHNTLKSATGMTLRDFVEEQRIKRAANLLVSTDKTLTEIAYECGFSSQSYFSFAFKRKMKMTPREYVKQNLSKYDI